MATSPDRLILTNGGELHPALFGAAETEDTLIDKLEHWMADGASRALVLTAVADQDTYAVHHAYVMAFTAAIVVRAAEASSTALATGESESFADGQLEALQEERRRHQDVLSSLIALNGLATSSPRQSYAASIQFTW
ncbi:MAG: hypothetical protein H0V43_07215 [Gemmatimonadales bacterium]|nr:hypothetical protein [Gemmatimonadales bacterium]